MVVGVGVDSREDGSTWSKNGSHSGQNFEERCHLFRRGFREAGMGNVLSFPVKVTSKHGCRTVSIQFLTSRLTAAGRK